MRDVLGTRGIEAFALSKDTVEQAARHKDRDGLTLTLLSDAKLEVIRTYGLEHQKALEFSKAPIRIFGLPVGAPVGRRSMAIPTTLLIDEAGLVRWIDQADDYRMRGDASRIKAAIDEVFGSNEASATP